MPTLQELEALRFDHYQYASDVTNLVQTTFPTFQTVGFAPIRDDGALARYADVALPAFLMTFLAPDFENLRAMQPMLNTFEGSLGETLNADTGSSFVQMRVNVSGVLMLPVNPAENDILKNVVKNIALYEAAAIACLVVALRSQAIGIQTLDTVIESIETRLDTEGSDATETEIYCATEMIWSHEVIIGWDGTHTPVQLTQLFADIDQLTIGLPPERVVELPADPADFKDTDSIAEWVPLPDKDAPRYWLGFEGVIDNDTPPNLLTTVHKVQDTEWVTLKYRQGRWEAPDGTWVEFQNRNGTYSILAEGKNA